MQPFIELQYVGYLLFVIGLIGAVVPLLPGPPLIWLGALVWGIGDGFQAYSWPLLLVLALMVVLGVAGDHFIVAATTRRAGVSWRAIFAALVGGLVGGGIGGTALPIIGSVIGALLGAVLALVVVEYLIRKEWAVAWRASRAYLKGFFIGVAFDLTLCVAMIGVWALGAWVL